MKEKWMYRDDTGLHPMYHIHGDTYNIKEKIKEMGGWWSPEKKKWSVLATIENLEKLRLLNVILQVKVIRDAFCHEEKAVVYVDSADADRGWTNKLFCGNCDSHYGPDVQVMREL